MISPTVTVFLNSPVLFSMHLETRAAASGRRSSQFVGSEDPAKPKNQTPNATSASPTETIIT